MIKSRTVIAAGFIFVTTSCLGALFSDDEAHQKIGELQTQIQAMSVRVSTLEEAAKNQGLIDLLTQIQALNAEVTKLRGQIEVIGNEIQATQKRQKDMYIDLDSRLRSLEQVAAEPKPEAPAAAPATGKGAPGKTAKSKLPVTVSNESRVYEDAYAMFKLGNYQGAIVAFQDFVKNYPSSNLAPSAQYWIGNSFFAMREYKNAVDGQNKLIATYPASPKIPDAMLNIASAKMELGEKAQAKKILRELIDKYPITDAAETAKRRLASMN